MAFFVIVLGFGFFIIRPLSQADAELKIELENQQELMMETQQKLVMLPGDGEQPCEDTGGAGGSGEGFLSGDEEPGD